MARSLSATFAGQQGYIDIKAWLRFFFARCCSALSRVTSPHPRSLWLLISFPPLGAGPTKPTQRWPGRPSVLNNHVSQLQRAPHHRPQSCADKRGQGILYRGLQPVRAGSSAGGSLQEQFLGCKLSETASKRAPGVTSRPSCLGTSIGAGPFPWCFAGQVVLEASIRASCRAAR